MQVRKHLKSDGELTAEYCAHVQLFCRFCGDQITERNPSRSSSADNVDGTGIDKVIKHLDQGRSLWCGKCSAYGINCCLCQQSVHGAAFICSICGHGGHVGEIAAWFRNQIECPSGCGCRCAELLHATDFDQSFEAEDYSGEFQRNYAFD